MGYAEEIYARAEAQLSELKTNDKILAWLRKSKDGTTTRRDTLIIRTIAADLARPFQLEESFEDVTSTEEIKLFEENRSKLSFGKDLVSEEYVEERKKAIVEALADDIRQPVDRKSFEASVEALRELAPRKLGGLKTQDILKARRGLRDIFKDM